MKGRANSSDIKAESIEFYNNNPPHVSHITDINRRHFRMVLPNGRFLKIPDVIRTGKDLQKWLLRLAPIDVYYSTACWLDPTNIKPRPKKRTDDLSRSGILLSHDIVFDIDISPLTRSNLDSARLDTLKLYDHMDSKGYELKYAAFSGCKGFHLVFWDPDKTVIPDPYEREINMIKKRKELVKEVEDTGVSIDGAITCDTRRIVRLPGTINSKTGFACTVLSVQELKKPIKELIERFPSLPSSKNIPHYRPPTIGFVEYLQKMTRNLLEGRLQARAETRGKYIGDHCYTTYLSSNIPGIKARHAVLLSFSGRSISKVESLIEELIARYQLTDVYLFKLEGQVQAISLKSFQRNRLQKILDHAGADNASLLRKYNVTSIRIGPLVNEKQEEFEGPVKFIKTISAPADVNENTFVSAAHLNFLEKNKVEHIDYPKTHGSGEFSIIDAVVKL